MAKGTRFTDADLKGMGLERNEDGTYQKPMRVHPGYKGPAEAIKIVERAKTPFEVGVHEWFIPYQVPSKKNCQSLYVRNGKPGTTTSQRYKDYIALTKRYWEILGSEFKQAHKQRGGMFPINVEFTFYRSTKQRLDYIGPGESVQDIMVDFGWIPDDDTKHIKPFYGDIVVDAKNPGVKIKLL